MDAPGANDGGDDDEPISDSSGDDVDNEIVGDVGPDAAEEEEELISDPPIISEEAPVRLARNPADPTAEERARHDATHLPFRSWCPICVEARATEDPHYRQTTEERAKGLPRVCVDYCEIGENPDDEDDKQVMIVGRDKWSQAVHADIVEAKGNTDAAAAQGIKNFITSFGYKRIELKTDGEPALVDVAKTVKRVSEVDVLLKSPPAHDPQSNGVAERAVREVKEQLRATKIAFERRLKSKIDPKSPVLLWMVVHSVETINRFLVGADGRTPHYRLHNRNFVGKVLEFGEMVYAKPLRKSTRKRALMSRAVPGIWLGIIPRTGEHRVALLGGGPVIRVRTVIRKPDSGKWSDEEIKKIEATPRHPNPRN